MNKTGRLSGLLAGFALTLLLVAPAQSVPIPGGSLDPLLVPKYVQPLVIPPAMPASADVNVPAANYNIAVRQFKQQILPGGVWNTVTNRTDPFGPTTLWSYGRAEDTIPVGFVAPAPRTSGVSFNYPAFTIENTSMVPTTVRWINDLVADPAACAASVDKTIPACNFLPHLFPVDQSLHWANPPMANCMVDAMNTNPNRTDCKTEVPTPYTGPIPLVTHVHGAHVQPHSDGYPQAWWLPGVPGTKGIPATYAERGMDFTQANNANTVAGSAYYSYENSQPAATIWYHDHAMGMTRLNVYAGPAGFWLIRGGANDINTAGVLPGPAPSGNNDPNFNSVYRGTIREIPIAIQDRSFDLVNASGVVVTDPALATEAKLFYPQDRTFFDGFTGPYIGGTGTPAGLSDMSGIWNPEAFFNTMVVNGTTWPKLEVAPARYRLRLLDGCNSRTLNLALKTVTSLGADGLAGTADDVLGAEIPIYQIGGDQGFLPKVVKITSGFATMLPGDGTTPADVAVGHPMQALLLGPAERADVIVDFSTLQHNTRVRMVNTAPDAPFGALDPLAVADPTTTGQVMDFVVNNTLLLPADAATTPVTSLVLPAEAKLGAANNTRQVSLNELVSDQVCVEVNAIDGTMVGTLFSTTPGDPTFLATCANATVAAGNLAEPSGPRMAVLGVVATDAMGTVTAQPMMWSDPITEIPLLGSTEIWEIYNTTMDAHPIHLHLVRYQVVSRQNLDPAALMMGKLLPIGVNRGPRPNERGYKDTVIAYPGQVTRIKAKFDIAGLYVWHCHIVEHEDNEMMRPFVVAGPPTTMTLQAVQPSPQTPGTQIDFNAAASGGSGTYQYRFLVKAPGATVYTEIQPYSANALFSWNTTTLAAGTYMLLAQARNNGSKKSAEVSKYNKYELVAVAPVSGGTVSANLRSPHVAAGVIFSVTNLIGSGIYDYKWSYRKNGGALTLLQDYGVGTATLQAIDLPGPGVYTLVLNVRNSGSIATSELTKWFGYTIQ